MKSPKDQNTFICLESNNAYLGQNGMNRDDYPTSFNTIINQEVQFEDSGDERSLHNLSLEDLNNKVEIYKNLFLENKINRFNAFEIDLISCVLQVVKKTKETNFLEISNTFDAMSKVYTCRVDDFLTMGNKLVKEFLLELNHKKYEQNEMISKPNRKKVMLTTAEKLHLKEHLISSKTKYLNINFDIDVIDYAKPSRIFINIFSCITYWPEYNFSKTVNANNSKNQKIKYEMENISCQIKKGKICPYYHQFLAECDNTTNDDDLNILDNITTHFDPETSILSIENSEEPHESMDINMNEQTPDRIVNENSSPNNRNNSIDSRDNLVSISHTLSIVDTTFSDYTFFDSKRLRYFKCPNHWKDKFKRMIMTSKQKAMYIKSHVAINDFDTSLITYVPKEQCNKSRNIQYKVDFNVNMTAIMKKLKNNIIKHKCNYNLWKPCNNMILYTNEQKMSPFRRSQFCKYLNMIPDWYTNYKIDGLMELNYMTPQGSLIMLPEQNNLNENLICKEISNATLKNTDKNITTSVNKSDDENYMNQTEMNSDYNYNIHDDTHEAFKQPKCVPRYIDMNALKKSICHIIKPNSNKTLNITFKDLLLRLPKLLSEKMKENISVAIIFVALLHLSNEHNLHLENYNDEIIISQG